MRERGDFQCLHEPFLRYYYLQRTQKKLAHFDGADDQPETYHDTRELILKLALKGSVFAKDMSYYVIPELLEDIDFCSRIRHCFLIRHPRKSILSYNRLDPDFSCEEIGLNAQWQHYQGIEKLGLEKPVVIEAEAIQADTKNAMRQFWQALGLDFIDRAFAWSSDTTPPDWQYVEGWHQKVGESNGIRSISSEDEQKSLIAFEKAVLQAPHLEGYYKAHKQSYEALKSRSLTA